MNQRHVDKCLKVDKDIDILLEVYLKLVQVFKVFDEKFRCKTPVTFAN